MRSGSNIGNAADAYRRQERRRAMWVVSLTGLLAASLVADLTTGPAGLSPSVVVSAVVDPTSVSEAIHTIVWTFRLPTALMAVVVGASLGIAGAEMQTVLNNPLASPFTLGVSAAASFGAALVMVYGAIASTVFTALAIPLSAFGAAMLCSLALYGIGRLRSGSAETVIVGGVALHFIFSSGVALLQYVAPEDTLQAIVFWLFGSLQGANWETLAVVAGALALTSTLLSTRAWQLTALRLGDRHAESLGIDVQGLRLQILLLISFLTATAVCFTGAIGFIGLVAPHLARMTVGEDQRYFMPVAGLYGAVLVSAAAVVSEVSVPGTVIPIGITTAAIGAPFFAAVAVFRRQAFW